MCLFRWRCVVHGRTAMSTVCLFSSITANVTLATSARANDFFMVLWPPNVLSAFFIYSKPEFICEQPYVATLNARTDAFRISNAFLSFSLLFSGFSLCEDRLTNQNIFLRSYRTFLKNNNCLKRNWSATKNWTEGFSMINFLEDIIF